MTTLIEERLSAIAHALNLPKSQHSESELREAYEISLTQLIFIMQQRICLPCGIILARVNSGLNSPAKITIPIPMPTYGTSAFLKAKFILYIQKEVLATAKFESIVYMIAHELAHIVLHSTNSPFRKCEMSTDLCAMLLGYDHMISIGHLDIREKAVTVKKPFWKRPFFTKTEEIRGVIIERYGYLETEQVLCAARHIKNLRRA